MAQKSANQVDMCGKNKVPKPPKKPPYFPRRQALWSHSAALGAPAKQRKQTTTTGWFRDALFTVLVERHDHSFASNLAGRVKDAKIAAKLILSFKVFEI